MDRAVRDSTGDGRAGIDLVRLAAVGDLHAGRDSVGHVRRGLHRLAEHAQALLLAGDLTQHGDSDEARVLASELG